MTDAYIDTSIIIRLLTADDEIKQRRSRELFERIERHEVAARAPVTVIADAVYVLHSPKLYALPREEISALLIPLVRLRALQVESRSIVLRALQLFADGPSVDFGDLLIVAAMEATGSRQVYSYDRDFDHFKELKRVEP